VPGEFSVSKQFVMTVQRPVVMIDVLHRESLCKEVRLDILLCDALHDICATRIQWVIATTR